MRKEENQCWMRKRFETLKEDQNKKLEKQDKITKITLLYKEKVNLRLSNQKNSKLKWKDKEDKQ